MRRRLRADDPIEDFDIEFNPDLSATKLPTDITGGMKQLTSFMDIPCSHIVEFRQKRDSDFSRWSEEAFEMLVDSVREHGVLEPVTVRPIEGEEPQFEMLAGEHRWRASMACGRVTIPARVVRECSDEAALEIFSITNLLRRENSLRDKVNGWWHLHQISRYKRKADLDRLVEEGVIDKNLLVRAKGSGRQISNYVKMHDLIDALMDLAEAKKISIKAATHLAYLMPEHQEDLVLYASHLNDVLKASQLRKLEEAGNWTEERIQEILVPADNHVVIPFRKVEKNVGLVIRSKLPETAYERAADIVERALDLYLEAYSEF